MMVYYIYLMNNIQKRFILFLFGCITIRLLFVYFAKNASSQILMYMGYFALIPAFGFAYIYITNSRQSGSEVFGEKIWWNYLRPLHSLLYFLFACNAIIGNKTAWLFLLVDVLIGLILFLFQHWKKDNFNKLF